MSESKAKKVDKEHSAVFAVAPGKVGKDGMEEPTTIIVVMTPQAIERMTETSACQVMALHVLGMPIRVMCFAAANHEDARKLVENHNRARGLPVIDAQKLPVTETQC